MATKIQKIFAKYIRTKNPNERKSFGSKLKGVKASQVSYTKDGKKYTIHGNLPWKKPTKKTKAKKRRTPYSGERYRKQQQNNYENYTTQNVPKSKATSKATSKPKPKDTDADYWDGYKKTMT